MANKTVRELAQALSDSERRSLVTKIEKSLQLDSDSSKTIFHSREDKEERVARIRLEIQKMNIWQKIGLFFRKLFSTHSEEEIVFELSNNRIIRSLGAKAEELIRIDGRWLEPGFAQLVYKMYLSLLPLLNIFREFWKNPAMLQGLIEYILENRVPNSKSSIFRFATFAELQESFEKFESKEAIKKQLIHRIDRYIENTPPEIFNEIASGILPLYYYKELILFDFESFFNRFQVNVLSISEGAQARFKPARIDGQLDQLERLYYAVFAARRAQAVSSMHREVFIYFQTMREESDGALPPLPGHTQGGTPAVVEKEKSKEAYSASSILGDEQKKVFRVVSDAVEEFWKRGHLGNIIRFFRHNPYYRFIAYAPTLNVKEFYISALRLKVLGELDGQFSNIRQEVISRKKLELFQGNMQGFEFYRRSVLSSSNVNLPVFRYVDSLLTLYQFLIYRFERIHLEMLRILSRVLPERYRDYGSRIVLNIANIEEILDLLKAFDYSFSPLSDDGKSFFRLRFSAEKDLTQLKAYRVIVSQKDQEARGFLDRGGEHFRNLAKICEKLLEAPLDAIDDRFQDMSSTGNGSLTTRLGLLRRDLELVLKIMFYEQQLEEEAII